MLSVSPVSNLRRDFTPWGPILEAYKPRRLPFEQAGATSTLSALRTSAYFEVNVRSEPKAVVRLHTTGDGAQARKITI